MNKQLTRRDFLKVTGQLGVASALASSGLTSFNATAASGGDDYKALVCILLAGGADSFNMLVPTDNSGYTEYASVRSDLALGKGQLLPLNNAANGSRTLGFHPGMTELQTLYNSGDLACLANVGTLVKPTTPQQLANNTAEFPLGLHSHRDQIDQWQTASPDSRIGNGWGGRVADLMHSNNGDPSVAMNMSLAGNNLFQSGLATSPHNVTTEGHGTVDLANFEQDPNGGAATAMRAMYEGRNFNSMFRRAYANAFNQANNANGKIAQAIGASATFGTAFGTDELALQLKMTARLISVAKGLGFKRQTFFITYDGWDHHDDTLKGMQTMVPVLSKGMSDFHKAMQELGMQNQVTTFTMSDFGRTLTSNGKGSDHGWGGNHLIMGGAVKGGKIYGQYPSLALDNPLDTGRGVLMPTTATDSYFAELALWLGVPASQLPSVLPNINRFYNPASGNKPLGFMA